MVFPSGAQTFLPASGCIPQTKISYAMATLNVQQKSPTPWWFWLLILLIGAAIIYFLLDKNNSGPAGKVIANIKSATHDTSIIAAATKPNRDNIDFSAPGINYTKLSDTDIAVRGKNNYSIYALGENIIFNRDESNLEADCRGETPKNRRFAAKKV